VIKVESPKRPDLARTMGAVYNDLNEMKEFAALDLLDPNDRLHFDELVKKADGLIEGFRPNAKKKLGLDEETLHKINPKLCIVSLVGYPEDGPWRDRAGHDLNFAALSGCLSLFQEMPGLPLADLFSAYEGALGLTAGMDAVARGAPGTRIVVSMAETIKKVQSTLFREYQDTGIVPRPGETLYSGRFPCYQIYTTADHRRISVGAIEHKFWEKVCQILEVPHLLGEGYATGARRDQVIKEIQKVFQTKPWSQWALAFDKADCCVEPVLDYSEVFKSGI
jgi:crotonobetainyl-CoA:carnitine CoA-transferase CaiB-like acyl-CoA transferase